MTTVNAVNDALNLRATPKCSVPLDVYISQSRLYRNLLAELKQRHPADLSVFDATDLLCDYQRRVCELARDGWPLYSFTDHISGFAATKIAARLVPLAEGLAGGR